MSDAIGDANFEKTALAVDSTDNTLVENLQVNSSTD